METVFDEKHQMTTEEKIAVLGFEEVTPDYLEGWNQRDHYGSEGVLLGGDKIRCQTWQPLSRSPSSSLMKDVNVWIIMVNQP